MDIDDVKQLISFVAVCLTFIAYVPYYRDILRGKTHPHVYSWSLWGLLTVLIVTLLAVKQYTILSSLWLAVWAMANGLFSIMIVVRRKQVIS